MREDKDGGRWCTPTRLPACLQHPALQEWDARLRSPGGGSGRSGGLATIGRRLRPGVLLPSRRQSGQGGSRRRRLLLPPSSTCRHGRSQNRKTPNRLLLCTTLILCVCGIVVIIFPCFVFVFDSNNSKVKIECNPAKLCL
jgi:hypothetical protein